MDVAGGRKAVCPEGLNPRQNSTSSTCWVWVGSLVGGAPDRQLPPSHPGTHSYLLRFLLPLGEGEEQGALNTVWSWG